LSEPKSAHIRDRYLLRLVDAERERRGDTTIAKTMQDLCRERLSQIEHDQRANGRLAPAQSN